MCYYAADGGAAADNPEYGDVGSDDRGRTGTDAE